MDAKGSRSQGSGRRKAPPALRRNDRSLCTLNLALNLALDRLAVSLMVRTEYYILSPRYPSAPPGRPQSRM